MIIVLFLFLFSFSKANEQLEYPSIEKYQRSQINLRELSECPFENSGYSRIEQEPASYAPGNYYACNMKFRSKIEINQGLLLIHNCNFTFVSSNNGAIYVVTPDTTSSQESVQIQNCHFYQTTKGAIHIESKLQSNAFNIINCTFEKCQSSLDPSISCIYLKVSSGNIEKCKFINNRGNKADIYYSNYGADGRITIKSNLFRRSDGSTNSNGDLITFDTNSYFDFIDNMISVGKYVGIVRIFSDDSDLSNIDNFKFEGNSMFPVNNEIIANKINVLKNLFPENENIPCPPIILPIDGTPVKQLCGSPFEHLGSQAFQAIQSYVSIVYCTFDYINNSKSLKGGAIYILINENMPIYDEPIRIYNSDFYYCNTLYGCAIYIESYQDSMKFDFKDCYFGNNFYNFADAEERKNDQKGGAVYIKTKFSSFEFTSCSFFENKAGEGGAIYYISETDKAESENIQNDYSLHITDCKFYHNEGYSNGAGIFISVNGYEHSKPNQIDNCIFYQNFANEAEGGSDQPENGGAIYYSASYTNHASSTNSHDFSVINCFLRTSIATYRGGGIYLLIKGIEPSRCIEISQSYFRGNQMADSCYGSSCASGADIFFEFDSTTPSSSQLTDHILDINNCQFLNYNTNHIGGSVSMAILNQEPSKSIEINGCSFSNSNPETVVTGAAIYYDFSPLTTKATKLLDESNNDKIYALSIVDCLFSSNDVVESGGSISINIEKREQSNPIQINGCTFINGKSVLNGGYIYYSFNTDSSIAASNENTLLINNCSFTGSTDSTISKSGGSIYIEIKNGDPSKSIEINNCTFTNCIVDETGGAIYYNYLSTTSFATKTLLDETSPAKLYSLNIVDCKFTSNKAYMNGGAVGINIETKDPSNPIEFRGCTFTTNSANDQNVDNEYGGAIYYINKAVSSSSSKSLLESKSYVLGIFDSIFNENDVSYYGGAISIKITNANAINHVEINGCSFDKNKASVTDLGCGSSICYEFIPEGTKSSSKTLLEESVSLFINNCNFTGNSATGLGDVYIETGYTTSVLIELNSCLFKDASYDGVSLKSTNPSTLFHINDCDFKTSSMIYFYSDVASSKIENCRFTDMSNRAISYVTDSDSQTVSDSNEFRVENCNFTQTSEIVSLVHFVSPLMHQFYFISNNISIENENTRALGSNDGVFIGTDGWHFENNIILPGRGNFIKTDFAKDIPASCMKGFICSDLPQCVSDVHCNFDATISGEDKPSVTLTKLNFNNVNHNDNGAAIYVYNFHISCNEIEFKTCTSFKSGGGIYIYLDKEIESPILLENLHFNDCTAICGGGIYAYSNIIANKINIRKCIFDENHANESPKIDGDILFGGSAIYLATASGTILRCTFMKNVGIGVKIINDFETLNQVKMSIKSQSSIMIEDCTFETDQKSKSSIFYVRGKEKEIPVDVKNCLFKGNLAEGSYHIDGESFEENKEPMNLHIKSCKFSDGMKSAVNIQRSRILLNSIENNNEMKFISNEKDEKRSNSKIELKIYSFVVVGFACFGIIIAFAILIRMKVNKQNEIDEKSIEL